MDSFDFSVSGVAKQICVYGSDDRYEIKQVVDGAVVPYRVNGDPVFVGGDGGACAVINDDGDYTIEYPAGDCDPFLSFTEIDYVSDDECGKCVSSGGFDVRVFEQCDLDTKTVWYKTVWFELGDDGVPVENLLTDWTDSGRVCALDADACNPAITEFFGDGLDAAEGLVVNDVTIHSPVCCDVIVKTSAGNFTVKADEAGFEKSFKCAFTVESVTVTGDCDKSKVHFLFVNDGMG